jgi:ubiquinone/menaquinone biosynthesis C-methylase UbiE
VTDYLDRVTDFDDPAVASAVDEVSLWSSAFGRMLLDRIPMGRGVTALDLGSGCGFPLFELAHRLGPSSRVAGLDVWKPAIERAAGKLALHGLRNVLLVRGDGAKMPFARDAFDLIVSNVGVNNFAEPEAALAECARVLKRGGRIALTTNPRGHMAELYAAYREVLRGTGRAALVAKLDAQEDHRATPERIRGMLADAGLRTERMEQEEMRLRYVDGGAMLRHSLTRFGFLDGWRSILPRDEEREVFAALEARLDAMAAAAGELVLRVPMLYVEAVRPR